MSKNKRTNHTRHERTYCHTVYVMEIMSEGMTAKPAYYRNSIEHKPSELVQEWHTYELWILVRAS